MRNDTFLANQLCSLKNLISSRTEGTLSLAILMIMLVGAPVLADNKCIAVRGTSHGTLSFGTVVIGLDSVRKVSIVNRCGDSTNVTIAMAGSTAFKTLSNVTLRIPPKKRTGLLVHFSPARPGSAAGTLSIGSSAKTRAVALKGSGAGSPGATPADSTGLADSAALSPTDSLVLDFATADTLTAEELLFQEITPESLVVANGVATSPSLDPGNSADIAVLESPTAVKAGMERSAGHKQAWRTGSGISYDARGRLITGPGPYLR